MLRDCYFTNLEYFSIETLQTQRMKLRAILMNVTTLVFDSDSSDRCELMDYAASVASKGGKNKRRTIRKQIEKIEKYIKTRQELTV